MRCPHCKLGISIEFEEEAWEAEAPGKGYSLNYGHCPDCEMLIVLYRHGNYDARNRLLKDYTIEELIYPKHAAARPVEPEVPERYKTDFTEACLVMPFSAKASAALSRRILQDILREKFSIKKKNLADEIDAFMSLKDVPSYLTEAVDAVRNIGNFAAHPLKDTNTGEIVDVEPGEAEWLLDVIESLFDFTFVQPKRLDEKKKKLNQKLNALGKPPMKS